MFSLTYAIPFSSNKTFSSAPLEDISLSCIVSFSEDSIVSLAIEFSPVSSITFPVNKISVKLASVEFASGKFVALFSITLSFVVLFRIMLSAKVSFVALFSPLPLFSITLSLTVACAISLIFSSMILTLGTSSTFFRTKSVVLYS